MNFHEKEGRLTNQEQFFCILDSELRIENLDEKALRYIQRHLELARSKFSLHFYFDGVRVPVTSSYGMFTSDPLLAQRVCGVFLDLFRSNGDLSFLNTAYKLAENFDSIKVFRRQIRMERI
jgi:hypothetical protein